METQRATVALVVGSVTLDLDDESPDRGRPGGVAHYAGRALARLGAHTRVVTSLPAGQADLLLRDLRAEGVETNFRRSRFATTYLNDYSGSVDLHELRATSDPIRLDDVPLDWRDADLVQLGPLHRDDLLPEVVAGLRGLKGIDVQGLLREAAPDGTRLVPFSDLGRFLEGVAVVHASEAELPALLEGETLDGFPKRYGVAELIVTRGARGARVVTPGGRLDVPAPPARPRSKVGAGDSFLAGYLFFRAQGRGPADAAGAAAQVSAVHLERGEVPKGFRPRDAGR